MKVIDPLTIDAATPAVHTRAGTAWFWNSAGTLESAGTDVLRLHWSKADGSYLGVLVEGAATNLLLNTKNTPTNNYQLSTQTRAVSNGQGYVLSFYGSGSVNITGSTKVGGIPAASRVLAGTDSTTRSVLSFEANTTSLTFTVSGSVTHGQLEVGATPTSVIVTEGATVTRPADVISGYGVFYNGFTDSTPAYNALTAYDFGDVVQYGGRLYESQVAGVDTNTGNTPGVALPTIWLDTGPNNLTAAFDGQVSTRSAGQSQEESICLRLSSASDGLALFGLVNVSYVHAIISNGLMTGHQTLYKSGYPTMAVLQTTGAATGNIVTITLNSGSGVVFPGVGEIVVGDVFTIGETEFGAGLSLIDYSRKSTDEFGVTTFVERAFAKRLSANVLVEKADFNTVNETLFGLRATPTVWIVSDEDDYSSAIVYGFLRDLRAVISYPTASLYSLEIEGLT